MYGSASETRGPRYSVSVSSEELMTGNVGPSSEARAAGISCPGSLLHAQQPKIPSLKGKATTLGAPEKAKAVERALKRRRSESSPGLDTSYDVH